MTPRDAVHAAAVRYPGADVAILAHRSGYGVGTVRRALTTLRAHGLVITDRRGHWSAQEAAPEPATPPTLPATVCVRVLDWWAPVTVYPDGALELGQAHRGDRREEPPAGVAVELLVKARTAATGGGRP